MKANTKTERRETQARAAHAKVSAVSVVPLSRAHIHSRTYKRAHTRTHIHSRTYTHTHTLTNYMHTLHTCTDQEKKSKKAKTVQFAECGNVIGCDDEHENGDDSGAGGDQSEERSVHEHIHRSTGNHCMREKHIRKINAYVRTYIHTYEDASTCIIHTLQKHIHAYLLRAYIHTYVQAHARSLHECTYIREYVQPHKTPCTHAYARRFPHPPPTPKKNQQMYDWKSSATTRVRTVLLPHVREPTAGVPNAGPTAVRIVWDGPFGDGAGGVEVRGGRALHPAKRGGGTQATGRADAQES